MRTRGLRSTRGRSTRSRDGWTATRSDSSRTCRPVRRRRRSSRCFPGRHRPQSRPTEEPKVSERPKAGQVETRHNEIAAEGRKIHGVVPYGIESRDMGGWREVIEPGALRATKLDDLVATVDHAGVPIGRYPTTLELEDRSDGLSWAVTPPQSRADVREAIERGDLKAGSWRMVVGRDEWRGDTRHVHEIAELRDVSVVSSPAYPTATVEYRAAPTTTNKEDNMSEESTPSERTEEARSEDK